MSLKYYRLNPAYKLVCGMDDFEPWLTRLETEISADVLSDVANDIPPEWYACDSASIQVLLARLNRRRGKVRELLLLAQQASPQVFPNWVEKGGEKSQVSRTASTTIPVSCGKHVNDSRSQ